MVSHDTMPGMLFQELHRVRHSVMQTELAARGMGDLGSPMILFVLKHRGQRGEIGVQRKLSEILHVSPATIAVSIKSLERAGYVEKRPDEADARRNRIALTEKGNRAVDTCAAIFMALDEKMFRDFSQEESALINCYFKRMIDNLRQAGTTDAPCERMKPIC